MRRKIVQCNIGGADVWHQLARARREAAFALFGD